MRITDEEFTTLIREAVNPKFVSLGFGPGGTWIKDLPENAWAIQRVTEMRSPTSSAEPKA